MTDHSARLATTARGIERGTIRMCAGLVLANVAVWTTALVLFADRPAQIATCLLAWTLGLRHAVDADHIAAIDNTVRKLMQDGARANSAGLYFALGHSTVVMVATLLLAFGAVQLAAEGPGKATAALIGTSVSALFLLLIALLNLVIFIQLCRSFRALRRRGAQDGRQKQVAARGGLLTRLLGPVFRVVSKPWHLYPLGLLFGLGFDTATEIGLLAISAAEAVRGASPWEVLLFPALFAAAMALVDTADSVLMARAYHWAVTDPERKLWYNLVITGASVAVALFIGGLEALDLLAERFDLAGEFWSVIAHLNHGMANFGFAIVALFVAVWLAATVIHRTTFGEARSPTHKAHPY